MSLALIYQLAVSQPYQFQQFQKFKTRHLYVKKKNKNETVIFQKSGKLQIVMIRLSFL